MKLNYPRMITLISPISNSLSIRNSLNRCRKKKSNNLEKFKKMNLKMSKVQLKKRDLIKKRKAQQNKIRRLMKTMTQTPKK